MRGSPQRRWNTPVILTCESSKLNHLPTVRYFEPVGTCTLPEYKHLSLKFPPFLELAEYCFEQKITHIHASTPGPMGLAAVAIARILNLPISGTYHTSFQQYAKLLTEDLYVEEMMWKAMLWFYDQMEYVYAPSRATGQELVEKGLSEKKVVVYPRGVATERFHPGKRAAAAPIVACEDTLKLLYVGRVSKEENFNF